MKPLRALAAAFPLRREIASAIQVFAVRCLVLTVNLATGVLSAGLLGPHGRGIQAALMIGPQVIGPLAEIGLHAALIYNVKNDPPGERRYLGAAMLLGLVTGLLGLVAGWLLAPLWLSRYDSQTIAAARMLLAVVPAGVVMHIMMGALEARGEFGLPNRLGLLGSLVTLLALVALWLGGRLTPTGAATAYLLPTVPLCGLLWLRTCRGPRGPVLPDGPIFARRLLHVSLRFFGIDILGVLGGYLDQFVLVLVLAPEMVGIYVVALSASRVLNVIPTSIAMVLFPRIAARSEDDVLDLVGTTARLAGMATAGAALCLAVLGPHLLALLYGPRFAEAVAPFRLLLVEVVLSNVARIFYQAFGAVGRPEIVSVLEALGLGTAALAMLVLVPKLGAIGAAAALLAAGFVRLCAVLTALPLVLGVRMPRLVVARSDLRRVFGP